MLPPGGKPRDNPKASTRTRDNSSSSNRARDNSNSSNRAPRDFSFEYRSNDSSRSTSILVTLDSQEPPFTKTTSGDEELFVPIGLEDWDGGFFLGHRWILRSWPIAFLVAAIIIALSIVQVLLRDTKEPNTYGPLCLLSSPVGPGTVAFMVTLLLFFMLVPICILVYLRCRHPTMGDPHGMFFELVILCLVLWVPKVLALIYIGIFKQTQSDGSIDMTSYTVYYLEITSWILLAFTVLASSIFVNAYPVHLVRKRERLLKPSKGMSNRTVDAQFRHLLERSEGYMAFQKCCAESYSSENLLFWREIQLYKKMRNPVQMLSYAELIWKEFMEHGSRFAVCSRQPPTPFSLFYFCSTTNSNNDLFHMDVRNSVSMY